MDEQDIVAIEQVFATVTNTLRTGSRGDAWRYDTTQFEEAGSALLAEVRRLRAGLRDLVDATMDDGNTPAATRAHLRAQALLDS